MNNITSETHFMACKITEDFQCFGDKIFTILVQSFNAKTFGAHFLLRKK